MAEPQSEKSLYTPYDQVINKDVMGGAWIEWRFVKGPNIIDRIQGWGNGLKEYKTRGVWHFYKSSSTAPKAETEGHDEFGGKFKGINLAVQDYLSMGSRPVIKEAAIKAIQDYGVHSGGSPAAMGRTKYYHQLCKDMSEFLGTKSTILYATGWLAGYGVISALVRPYDYVIMDKLAHNCLQEGSFIATKNVFMTRHLDNKAVEDKLKEIREKDQDNGILVVTEGLFSMDADTPDINGLQKICKKYNAVLLLDMAHDFGIMGANGRGTWEDQGIEDKSNMIFMGAGSKVLSANLGFVSCDNENAIEYIKMFSTSLMFTNAVSPVQAATASAVLKILRTSEGQQLRQKCIENARYLREKLNSHGIKTLGNPSPVVPLWVGDEKVIRVLARILLDRGYLCNPMEFPAVPYGTARFRLQLQAGHTKEQMDLFANAVVSGWERSKEVLKKIHEEKETQPGVAKVEATPRL